MPSRTSIFALLLEAMVVAAAAAGFAFAANEFSPRGLKLARDYFPSAASPSSLTPKVSPPSAVSPASTNQNSEAAQIEGRIQEKGLQPVDLAQTERLFHDPRYAQGLVVFVDARDEDHYAQGHIPGAYELDRYHPEKDLPGVLTPCQIADLVLVYCAGGDCDDADYAAVLLREAGVPNSKLMVYGGGFDEWSAGHLPVEKGARNSGLAPVESK